MEQTTDFNGFGSQLQDYERKHIETLRASLAECTVLLKTDGSFRMFIAAIRLRIRILAAPRLPTSSIFSSVYSFPDRSKISWT